MNASLERASLLQRLLRQGAVLCPRCRRPLSALAPGGAQVRCEGCGAQFPIRHGVVDLFADYRPDQVAAPPASAEVLTSLACVLGMEPSGHTLEQLGDIWRGTGRRARMGHHTAEIADVLDRFGISPAQPPRPAAVRNDVPLEISARCERHYVEPALPAGRALFRGVRVRNDGDETWSSEGEHATGLGYRWLYPSGGPALLAGRISAFPIPIEPGRAITLPLEIETPQRPGEYVLRVLVEQRSRRRRLAPFAFLGQAIADIPVRIGEVAPSADVARFQVSEQGYSYAEDHERARQMLKEHVERASPAPGPLLEVGGGTHPQARGLGDLVNVDISAVLLELGMIEHGARYPGELLYACADAMDLPFADGTFSGACLFAALHHFAEPDALLVALKRKIRPFGFVAVLCEPLGSNLSHEGAVRDLLKGINEQTFTLEEWCQIFRRAGFEVEHGTVEGGSLKAFLTPIRSDIRQPL